MTALIKFADDESGLADIKDRAYSYDAAGRLQHAYSGVMARNFVTNTPGDTPDGPYDHEYAYDEWDNLLADSGNFWSRTINTQDSYVASSNRNPSWSYDADGNLLSRNELATTVSPFVPARYTYDAAARQVGSTQKRTYTLEIGNQTTEFVNSQTFDGDNQMTHYALVRNITYSNPQYIPGSVTAAEAYLLRSTVLGGSVISEYKGDGTWSKTHVYAGGERLGQQTTAESGSPQSILETLDPVTGDGVKRLSSGTGMGATTMDPGGVDVGTSDPFPLDGSGDAGGGLAELTKSVPFITPIEGGGAKCILDGLEIECGRISGNSSVQCPNNDCGPKRVVYQGDPVWAFFQGFADGYSGYVPTTAQYIGNGGLAPASGGGRPTLKRATPTGRRRDTDLNRLNGGRHPEDDLGYNYSEHIRFLSSPLTIPQNPGEMIPARNLLPEVYHLLDNDRCFTFISNLLNVARQLTGRRPYTYDAYELAKTIATQPDGGITFYPGAGGGDAAGDIFSGNARVGIFLFPKESGRNPVGAQVSYALVALHEFIHLAGGANQYGAPIYSDYVLARAANIYTGAPGYPSGPPPRTREEQDKLRTDTGNYWDRQLREHCSPTGG